MKSNQKTIVVLGVLLLLLLIAVALSGEWGQFVNGYSSVKVGTASGSDLVTYTLVFVFWYLFIGLAHYLIYRIRRHFALRNMIDKNGTVNVPLLSESETIGEELAGKLRHM